MNKIVAICPVSTNRRITLPEIVAEKLNVGVKDRIIMFEENGRIVLEKAEV